MAKKTNIQQQNLKLKSVYVLQAQICSALAHPVRLHILDLISDGEMNAGDLLEVLQIPKANLSQHLSVLKEGGVIHARKEGLYQYFSLAIPKIKDACGMIKGILSERLMMEEEQNSILLKELKKAKRSL
jgi:ArsR family transcriptional regulator, virulence genes transcriptional regulator